MPKPACISALVLLMSAGPAVARPSLFHPDSMVRTTCVACHSSDKDGAVTRIESVRMTPEEWEYTLKRMERRYGFTLDAKDRKKVFKELAGTLGLTRTEAAKVTQLLRSPAASLQERLPAEEEITRVCASCHSWSKVLSHRRTPEAWKALKDFHLASFPSATILSYEEIKWRVEAERILAKLAKWLPVDTPEWQQERKLKPPDLSGMYLGAGRQPAKGAYTVSVGLKSRGDGEYEVVRNVLWEDGKRDAYIGAGALYGTHSLRLRFDWPGSHIKESAVVQPDGHLEATWQVKHYEHFFGDETLVPQRGGVKLVLVSPAWIAPGGRRKVRVLTTDDPAKAKLDFGPGTRMVGPSRPQGKFWRDGNFWSEVTLDVAPGAKIGRRSISLGAKPTRVEIAIAPRVDYITVAPEHGMARFGHEWDPAKPKNVPKQGATFEALGWSHGPDGNRESADDVPLGVLSGVEWSLEEFHSTPADHDLDYIGTLLPGGLFMPGDTGPRESSPSRNNAGNAWVVARWRPSPGADDLKARAYLWVTFPDLVKEVY